MWEDDRYWIPMVIAGERFQTRWIFDGDVMLDYEIRPEDRAGKAPGASPRGR